MAKTLSLSGIQTGDAIEARHVSQSVKAFTGAEAYDITVSGSLTVQGPVQGTAGTLNNFSSSYALTASYALNGGSGGSGGGSVGTLQQVMESGSITTLTITASAGISSSGAIISPSFTGSLSGSALESISASFAQTASYVTTAQTASYVLNAVSSSYALTASHALDAEGFPFSGSAVITGSLLITSSNQEQSLQLEGSGSTIFSVKGSRGTLFSVDDDESDGVLFSANNVSGIPVLEVHEDNTVKLGKQNGFGIIISGSNPLPNDLEAKILITGSTHITGSLEVNGDLKSSLIDSSNTNYKTVVIDPTTGKFYRTGSYAGGFPFSGSAVITGSLEVTGSISGSNLNISESATIDGNLTLTQDNTSTSLTINNGAGTEISFPGALETNITSEGLFQFKTSNNQGYGFGVNGIDFKAVIGDPGLAATATTVIADTYNGRLILRGNATPNEITGSLSMTGSAGVEAFISASSFNATPGVINQLTASYAITASSIDPVANFKPIVTHTSNFSSEVSYAGHYNIVGGTLTITVTTGSGLTPGVEWDFFQTSSGDSFTFTEGTGVDIVSRNNHKKLAAVGSAATLKYISGQTFHLVGDLTI